ncbi:MAG: hypothetical protein ACK5QX_09855, partial [bacterium]
MSNRSATRGTRIRAWTEAAPTAGRGGAVERRRTRRRRKAPGRTAALEGKSVAKGAHRRSVGCIRASAPQRERRLKCAQRRGDGYSAGGPGRRQPSNHADYRGPCDREEYEARCYEHLEGEI